MCWQYTLDPFQLLPTDHTGICNTSFVAYCLRLPRRRLHLSALLTATIVQIHGNKGAAVTAMQELDAASLGKLESSGSRKGTSIVR